MYENKLVVVVVLASFENLYSKRPAAAAAGSVKFHTLQRNEETKNTTK